MYQKLLEYCRVCEGLLNKIAQDRKETLSEISEYIVSYKRMGQTIQLMYVCTHNSRRSQFGQVWAAVMAEYTGISNLKSFSAGTEVTAFHINAINALRDAGLVIEKKSLEPNPQYAVSFSDNVAPLLCFSKRYDDASNPSTHFAAIMTCGEAEENCPFIPGVDLRVATTYNDPKVADGTPDQAKLYNERCLQIATETLFVMKQVKEKIHD